MSQAYDTIGLSYGATRRPDSRIAALIHSKLSFDMSVLNVGAGAGSYEPNGRNVVAVEPSSAMIAQRKHGSAPAVRAVAEALPFATRSVDAVLAVLTLHHWTNVSRGLAECVRVARDRVVILTWDPEAPEFWLIAEYFPQIYAHARSQFPSMDTLRQNLGNLQVVAVPIPADCHDGFLGAYWKSDYCRIPTLPSGAVCPRCPPECRLKSNYELYLSRGSLRRRRLCCCRDAVRGTVSVVTPVATASPAAHTG